MKKNQKKLDIVKEVYSNSMVFKENFKAISNYLGFVISWEHLEDAGDQRQYHSTNRKGPLPL